jgi:hypothetical protein
MSERLICTPICYLYRLICTASYTAILQLQLALFGSDVQHRVGHWSYFILDYWYVLLCLGGYIYRIRAAAAAGIGIGSACGLGTSPTPDLREGPQRGEARSTTRHTTQDPRPGEAPDSLKLSYWYMLVPGVACLNSNPRQNPCGCCVSAAFGSARA